ncbi:MAG TPA: heavy-metal-associated domain-containing protein [Candidatus Faecimonas intestinavium]|nr:heavy-metal-associated domain-containing protein [Candidatus Faecimonas intestinavium]
MNSKFKVKGLDCANCAAELERAIQKIEGIKKANISFMTERMELEYDENNEDEIIKKVKKVIKREEPDVTIEKI